eukprot:TRINITY_DN1482_c0_g2_i2.p1 TRINITY_DN1482_c0_g2~~TRINITY_DN1482_c0_g2_i2.p1  ORF type:complete len:178 (-),score=26.57 TRINITY_DN1482_c0_g2_i2:68-601(-)
MNKMIHFASVKAAAIILRVLISGEPKIHFRMNFVTPTEQIKIANLTFAFLVISFIFCLILSILFSIACCCPTGLSRCGSTGTRVTFFLITLVSLACVGVALGVWAKNWPSAMKDDDDPFCGVQLNCEKLFESGNTIYAGKEYRTFPIGWVVGFLPVFLLMILSLVSLCVSISGPVFV